MCLNLVCNELEFVVKKLFGILKCTYENKNMIGTAL